MDYKGLFARVEAMAALRQNYDQCGSVPAPPSRAKSARLLLAQLHAQGLLHAVTGLTVCPSGHPLFDFTLGERRASIVCEWPLDWHISVRDVGVLAVENRNDTASAVALLGSYLRGEIAAGDC